MLNNSIKSALFFLVCVTFALSIVPFKPVLAKKPPPLFTKPVKLDDSGRPLYNLWERQEYERHLREKQRAKRRAKKIPTQGQGVIVGQPSHGGRDNIPQSSIIPTASIDNSGSSNSQVPLTPISAPPLPPEPTPNHLPPGRDFNF